MSFSGYRSGPTQSAFYFLLSSGSALVGFLYLRFESSPFRSLPSFLAPKHLTLRTTTLLQPKDFTTAASTKGLIVIEIFANFVSMNGNRDFKDLLQCLNDAGARYLIAGAYAVIYHTEPRYTKDLDVWVEPTHENATKVWNVLVKFGAPLSDLTLDDLRNPEVVFQMGVEPNRIDIIMDVEGLRFPEAWENRFVSKYEDQTVFVLSRDDTVRAKKTAGRDEDLLDVKRLENAKRYIR